jgi:hypothetical protein
MHMRKIDKKHPNSEGGENEGKCAPADVQQRNQGTYPMSSGNRFGQQDNCPHRQHKGEKESERCIGFAESTRYCAKTSGLLFSYSSECIERSDNDWNARNPTEDYSPKKPLPPAAGIRAIGHRCSWREYHTSMGK